MQRYFFHSFPRLRAGESQSLQLAKGVKIARSLLDNGLLLTPENFEIPITTNDGTIVDSFKATQRRACFTELEPKSLPEHSTMFGPFSLAYEIPDLRRLGAMPVFYIPLQNDEEYLSGLPMEVFGGVIDVSRLLGQLLAIRNQLSNSPQFGLEYREKIINFNCQDSDAIRSFINILFDCAGTDAEATDLKLRTLASCFYPTENLRYTKPLDYYRQREWRILGSSLLFNDQPIFHSATPKQVEQLLAIDRNYFSKQITFFDPSEGIGVEIKDSIANRSHFFRQIGSLDVIGLAQYLVLPDNVDVESTLISEYEVRGVEVVKQSAFCGES